MQWLALLTLTSLTVLFETLARHVAHAGSGKASHIRGIPVSKSSLYSPDRDFECLDGSRVLAFDKVNDDYCDCEDGSDEPGTAACINGSFYCENTGYQPLYIPSSWVNDGVCDCCDASDEYSSNVQCVDNCNELGREAWIQAQRAAEIVKEGNRHRLEFVRRGKQLKTEHLAKIEKLKIELEEAELIKKEKEVIKTRAEERETAALEKYKPPPPPEPAEGEVEEESTEIEAEDCFKYLDSDSSGTVTVAELQTRVLFDKDRNGEVSREEALFFLNNQEEVTLQEFIDYSWGNVKPFLMREKGLFRAGKQLNAESTDDAEQDLHTDEEEHQEYQEAEVEHHDVDQEHEDEHEDEHEEEHEDGQDVEHEDESLEHGDEQAHEEGEDANLEQQPPEPEKPALPEYDEETQAIIDEAKEAREKYREVERSVHTLQNDISSIQTKLDRDYGPEEEFAVLDGECYEYTDYEYVYTLCPFDKVTQKPRSGGSEISLGQWNSWIGEGDRKYTRAKFDRGMTCWNGPPRTTLVSLKCGTETLLSVSEPNRCEYAMEFSTSALCNPNAESADTHDEL